MVPSSRGIEMPDVVRCRLVQKSQWAVAQTEPAMKNTSVIIIRVLPPPAVNRVPDAQPPPNCMPMPKVNAPMADATPMGKIYPFAGRPMSRPQAMKGNVKRQARPISSICARRPAPLRSRTRRRQAAVKPKEA